MDAGIDFIRISVIGYDKEKYKKWMNVDNFELILSNIRALLDYVKIPTANAKVSTYHLITNNEKINYEIDKYKENVISKNIVAN